MNTEFASATTALRPQVAETIEKLRGILSIPENSELFSKLLSSITSSAGSPYDLALEIAHDKDYRLSTFEAGILFGGLAKEISVNALIQKAADGDLQAKLLLKNIYSNNAIYAGSFDPFTKGHKDIAERAAKIFDTVFIMVGINPDKKDSGLFTTDERVALIKDDVKNMQGYFVVERYSSLTASKAHELNARTIIRGVREITDLSFEIQQAEANRKQSGLGDLETCILIGRSQFSDISSTNVRGIAHYRFGDISSYVSENTEKAVKLKVHTAYLKKTWNNLFDSTSSDKKVIDDEFNRLIKAYTSNKRFHHSLEHIFDMAKLLDELIAEGLIDKSLPVNEIFAAIFYHDEIYDVKSKTNEVDSAKSAYNSLVKLGWNTDRAKLVSSFIDATKDHQGDNDVTGLNLFLDLDLSILASNTKRYLRYLNDIKNEYAPEMNFPDFIKARKERFLNSFMQRPRIFLTDLMFDKFEHLARSNLQKESALSGS